MDGASLILAERMRVLHHEGYTKRHDLEHEDRELLDAAIAYIFWELGNKRGALGVWPWADGFCPSRDSIVNLVRAGQFIAAEIDRLQNESK